MPFALQAADGRRPTTPTELKRYAPAKSRPQTSPAFNHRPSTTPSTWSFKALDSSFGYHPTRPRVASPPIGRRPQNPITKFVQSNKFEELLGQCTKTEDIYGADTVTPAHSPWPGGMREQDWGKKPNFGMAPGYLADIRSQQEEAALMRSHSALSLMSAATGVSGAASSNASSAMSTFSKPTLSLSTSTVRLITHPIDWQRTMRAEGSKGRGAFSHANLKAPLCATYGLHPAFPRKEYVPNPLLATTGSSPALLSASSKRTKPRWKGSPKPFPQDRLYM